MHNVEFSIESNVHKLGAIYMGASRWHTASATLQLARLRLAIQIELDSKISMRPTLPMMTLAAITPALPLVVVEDAGTATPPLPIT